MAALRPVHRVLLYGILLAAFPFATTPSGAFVVVSPAPAIAIEALLLGDGRSGSEALLQPVHWGRFCRGQPRHRLCLQMVHLRRFCGKHPGHHLCDDDGDRFCRRHPNHRRCDDKPPSPS